MSQNLPEHFCPGCGAGQKPFQRYPWYFCAACLETAHSGAGEALDFANAGPFGGLAWRYRGAEEWQDAIRVKCLIRGRPVMVSEARFGGIVAEPLGPAEPATRQAKVTDLSH